mgnify:FL=1
MKGDFARVTFDPKQHYSQVFQQQGRVLLEADWNEQAQIQLHLLHTLVRDLVGPCWAAGGGFALASATTDPNGNSKPLPLTDWQLAPGHFYVDGILCANEAACTLAQQPNAPTPDYGVGDGKSGFENPPASFALWLDVWERHLSWIEAPSSLDSALDGIDTCSRGQVVWQLRMLDQPHAQQRLADVTTALNTRRQAATSATDTAAIDQQLAAVNQLGQALKGGNQAGNTDPCTLLRQLLDTRRAYALPGLRAELGPTVADNDPCVIAADARYRGMENQLYRVEIHQPGLAGTATFKWSRENGSVIFPVAGPAVLGAAADDGSRTLTVPLQRFGRDARLGLAANDWVELVDDGYTLGQRAWPLLQVLAASVADGSVTLAVPQGVTPWTLDTDPASHPLLRRWDQRDGANAQGVLPVSEGAAIALEDGVQVTFAPGGLYATGDYWLIPARVAGNGQLDWPAPGGTAATLPPRGLHHYAALGLTGDNGSYQECCCRFDSLCQLLRSRVANAPGLAPATSAAPTPAPATPATPAKNTLTPRKTPVRKKPPSPPQG